MNRNGSYVTVSLRIGSAQFARCTADVFDHDTLTISSIDDGADIRVLGPGQWRECVVFEGSGDPHPAFAFVARTPCAAILSPAQLRQREVA